MALKGNVVQKFADECIHGPLTYTAKTDDDVLSWGRTGDAGTKRLDQKWYGSASTSYMHLDASADTLYFVEMSLTFGHSAKQTVSDGDGATDLIPGYQFLGAAKADSSILLGGFNTTNDATVAPSLNFLKSGNATIGSNTIVAADEVLGEVTFFGADGTDFESPAARIQALVDTTPGVGDMPGRLVFSTTADGGETLTEALRITSAQDVRVNTGAGLIVGSTSIQTTISDGDGATDLVPEVQILGTAKADSSIVLGSFSATATTAACPSVNFLKSAHATLGSNTIVVSGEILGEINFFGADGTDFESPAARIAAAVDTTPGVGDMPGRLVFSTTADSGETLTEAMRITSAQDVRINDASGLIVGSTSAQITISDGDGATNLVPEVQVLGTTKTDGSILVMVNSATATSAVAPSLNFVKSAHATLGSNTIVASGEVLGEVNFFGADGTDFESCAVSIRGLVNAAPGVGDMPGRLSIFTSTDGAETPTERVRVTGTATASTMALGIAGATTGTITLAGTTSGVVTIQALAAAGTYSLSLPPDDGDSGEQLQTDGSGVMTWESAASYRSAKDLIGRLEPATALKRIVDATVHRFRYKQDHRGVGRDYETEFAGIVADEAPWAMKHKGRIFSEISAFGHAAAAIQALYAEITVLTDRLVSTEAKLAAIGG